MADSDEMADAVKAAYDSPNTPEKRPLDVVLLELDAFPLAVSVHAAEVKTGSAKVGARGQLFSSAKTILGSVGDLFNLTPFAVRAS
jgi:hypothetical protein